MSTQSEERRQPLHVSSGTSGVCSGLNGVPCLILVGGLGTRLRAVLPDLPKPMASVAGKPFLEYLIRWAGKAGCRPIVLCTGYGAGQIEQYFGSGDSLGLKLEYSVEREPLGTWGGIYLARKHVNHSHFVVLNGDSWLQVDLFRLLEFHRQKKSILSIAVVEVADSSRFGSVRLDASGRVVEFAEKRGEGPALINGGVYIFSREVFEAVGSTKVGSLEKEIFPTLMTHGIYAMRVEGYFVDIGLPETYTSLLNDTGSFLKALEFQGVDEGKC